MKTILHATDFSENAIAALKYAHTLSNKIQASLYVIHVFDNSTLSADLNENFLLHPKEILNQKNEILKEFCETHLKTQFDNVQLKTESFENNNIVTGIISKANEINASLIVVGMKGKSVIEEILLGSTTNQLIKKAPFPILTIPINTELNRLKTIVYATDFEEEDISAIFKLTQIAKVFNATIKIVHISPSKDTNGLQEMEWFKELLKQKVTYDKLEFDSLFYDDTYNFLRLYLEEIKADLLAMLERDEKGLFKKIFHRDLVKRMESVSAIPLISYNEINY